ncbi:hypothetical protein BDR04DRAFT_1128848 [Suillus decipiens]|nr:hypothetical protein BDR04DRAFT_1128848 [Suillus decipiens]
MREKKIGILCIQESHLTHKHEAQIEVLYSRRLKVFNSRDPFHPGNSAGVAFVINKEMINTTDAEITKIVLGRALAMSIKWHNDKCITILNIYALNDLTKHPDFWDLISKTWLEKDLPQADFVLGDFNLTEEALDRAPDTWRSLYPMSRLFTFYSNTNTYSHLDWIYMAPQHKRNTHHWESCTTTIPSDHKMVLVRFIPQNAPFIGNQCWTWPLSLMNEKKLFNNISDLGSTMQQQMTHQLTHRSKASNPQKTWEEFKSNITAMAKKTTKEHLHKIRIRTKQLEEDIKHTLENETHNYTCK